MGAARLLSIDPATWRSHALHAPDRIWLETNCYVDVWIEVLHAFGLEPLAALPFTVSQDFEGDHFTFFKFPAEDLRALYGGKGIVPDKAVVAYCRIGERSSHTWFVLSHLLGFTDVRNYDGSWTEWGNLVRAPIEKP